MKYLLSFLLFAAPVLHAQSAKVEAQIAALQSQVAALQSQVTQLRSSPIQALAPFVSVDLSPEYEVTGPNVVFTGCNVHIVDGNGSTGAVNGLGNLIIGYDEWDDTTVRGDRSGSHNIILGRYNKFRVGSWGSVVTGESNVINAAECAIVGGLGNSVTGAFAVTLGGVEDVASGLFSVVGGGFTTINPNPYAVLFGNNTPETQP